MHNLIFIAGVATALGLLYAWAFKHLPRERWQILCAIPLRKQADGRWQGLNLTYYGLINAGAVAFSLLMTFILLGAIGIGVTTSALFVCGMLTFCVPCAQWMARLVEKKKHTLSIGGAAFCGLMGVPLALLLLRPLAARWSGVHLPVMPLIAAMAIGYAFGEGSGRLACLSFGCCYGKPVDTLPLAVRRWVAPFTVVFLGETKKAAYASDLAGRRVVAIQAITAVVYSLAGLTGVYLFLNTHSRSAYLVCILTTQIWRGLSEFLRADFRGQGRISRYQYMAGIAALGSVIYGLLLPEETLRADLAQGLRLLLHPALIAVTQLLWIAIFIFTGRSNVTAAHISLYVRSDRI